MRGDRPRAYYNEIDPYAAQWLRNLIDAGEIPAGDVDERPIEEVSADEVQQYTQCHFFAGLGGWPCASRLAGWPDDRPIWTGSCPCQPFSVAGQRLAERDPRNLWPEFARLIAECRPAAIAGEQVASKAGRLWLAGVRADLAALGYAVGAADLCAAGVGAPHIRQRLWWVADADSSGVQAGSVETGTAVVEAKPCGEGIGGGSRLGDPDNPGSQRRGILPERADKLATGQAGVADPWGDATCTPCTDGKTRRTRTGITPLAYGVPARVGQLRAYGNAIVPQVAAEVLIAFMQCLGMIGDGGRY